VVEQVAGLGEENWQYVMQGQHQDKVGTGGRADGWGGGGGLAVCEAGSAPGQGRSW
jgi:hypothetical protein